MAQAGLIDVMTAIADQIRNVTESISDLDVQVEPMLIPNPTPPTVDIHPGDVSRGTESAGFGEQGEYLLTVRTRVATADFAEWQPLLLAFMDDTNDLCLGVALMDDPSLGGYASSIDIRDVTGYVPYADIGGDGVYIGFQFTVVVIPAVS